MKHSCRPIRDSEHRADTDWLPKATRRENVEDSHHLGAFEAKLPDRSKGDDASHPGEGRVLIPPRVGGGARTVLSTLASRLTPTETAHSAVENRPVNAPRARHVSLRASSAKAWWWVSEP
jgi:hypothetical protein